MRSKNIVFIGIDPRYHEELCDHLKAFGFEIFGMERNIMSQLDRLIELEPCIIVIDRAYVDIRDITGIVDYLRYIGIGTILYNFRSDEGSCFDRSCNFKVNIDYHIQPLYSPLLVAEHMNYKHRYPVMNKDQFDLFLQKKITDIMRRAGLSETHCGWEAIKFMCFVSVKNVDIKPLTNASLRNMWEKHSKNTRGDVFKNIKSAVHRARVTASLQENEEVLRFYEDMDRRRLNIIHAINRELMLDYSEMIVYYMSKFYWNRDLDLPRTNEY